MPTPKGIPPLNPVGQGVGSVCPAVRFVGRRTPADGWTPRCAVPLAPRLGLPHAHHTCKRAVASAWYHRGTGLGT